MFQRMNASNWIMSALLVLMFAMAGCATSSKHNGAASTDEADRFEHTVRYPGETLSLIAKWYTGDSKNWTVIAGENSNVNPSSIRLGDKILIPRGLMTNTEPLPQSFVKVQMTKSKGSQTTQHDMETKGGLSEGKPVQETPKAASAMRTEAGYEPELFGPKE